MKKNNPIIATIFSLLDIIGAFILVALIMVGAGWILSVAWNISLATMFNLDRINIIQGTGLILLGTIISMVFKERVVSE